METRIEINCTTGEILEIELTQAELDQRETDRIAYEMEQTNRETEAAAKAVARSWELSSISPTRLERTQPFEYPLLGIVVHKPN